MRAAFVLMAIVLAFAPPLARADVLLVNMKPAEAEALAISPPAIVLQFSQPLGEGCEIIVTNQKGRLVPTGIAIVTGKTLTLKLPPLEPGLYRVRWHAVSVDTHKTQGSYPFRIVAE